MERTGEAREARIAAEMPEIAADLAEVVIDPPDRTFAETAYLDLGDRRVELRFLGRGHTDHDIVITVPDAGVLFAGDLLENGAVPVIRRRVSARLAGDGLPGRRAGARRRRARVTATTAGGVRGRAGGRVRRPGRAGPPRPSRRA